MPSYKDARRAQSFSILPGESILDALGAYPRLLTPDELADTLAMSPKTIYAQAKVGTLPAIRIGQSVRFDPKAVASWLTARAA